MLKAVVIGIVAFVVAPLLLTVPVWLLWNFAVPDVFGLPEITFLQALAITILAHLLVKPPSDSDIKQKD